MGGREHLVDISDVRPIQSSRLRVKRVILGFGRPRVFLEDAVLSQRLRTRASLLLLTVFEKTPTIPSADAFVSVNIVTCERLSVKEVLFA